MKKFHLLGLALLAFFALSAVAANSASATSWLVEGKEFAGELAAETEVELELIRWAAAPPTTLILTVILCSYIVDGTIIWPNLGLITDILTLNSLEEVSELGGNKPLLCNVTHDDEEITDCEEGVGKAKFFVLNLSLAGGLTWETELLLTSANVWVEDFPANSGWSQECKALIGLTGSESCEGGTHAEALQNNEAGTSPASILGEFMHLTGSEAEELERGNCGMAEHVTETFGVGNTWAISAELTRLATSLS